jgi:hypothetical protein
MNELVVVSGILAACGNRVALNLPAGLDVNEWKRVGREICSRRDSALFYIGDWINYGQREYGEKYTEAKKVFCKETGYDENSLRVAASVCARVPDVMRLTSLSFTHHAVVAPYPAAQQKKWLRKAAKKNWSSRCRGARA